MPVRESTSIELPSARSGSKEFIARLVSTRTVAAVASGEALFWDRAVEMVSTTDSSRADMRIESFSPSWPARLLRAPESFRRFSIRFFPARHLSLARLASANTNHYRHVIFRDRSD